MRNLQSTGLSVPGRTEPLAENEEDNASVFRRLISTKSERMREAYQLQLEHLLKNKTSGRLIVKLKGAERNDDDDESVVGSFLDPFFKWVGSDKQTKFEKLKELKDRGLKEMSDKLDGWNLTGGLFQSFYGAETGLSVLELADSGLDLLTTWLKILADSGATSQAVKRL